MTDILFNELQAKAEKAVELLKALSHPTRLMVACVLIDTELSVGEIHSRLPEVSQSVLSQHLGVLRKLDVVETRRDSRVIYYRLTDRGAEDIIVALQKLFC